MSANNLEAKDKKSRAQLRREKPLFASRPAQQQPEFFTDSLNVSNIPTPSPPKNPARRVTPARPRRALGAGRSLATAFKATAEITDENRPPSSASSLSQRRGQQALKPRPTQTLPRTRPDISRNPLGNFKRITTPSPPRGRQNAIISPSSSASSPPRGLRESYQRIVDEENLAAQEGEEAEDMATYTDDIHVDEQQETDRIRLQREQDSVSPISLKLSRRTTRRASLHELAATSEESLEKENITIQSDGGSSMSFLEDITDNSFGRALTQHAKDEHRVNGALKNEGQIFRKARIGEKVGLTVENLRRRDGSNDTLRNGQGDSVSSRASDPSMNIPRAWGRKAKPGKDWLSRINSKSGRFTGDVPKSPQVEEPTRTNTKSMQLAEPIEDWITTTADAPVPSVENGSSQTTSSSRGSTPSSKLRKVASDDKIRDWDFNEDDFTARSLQFSDSPPIRIRNAALDRIREREIESLEKRAVTTNRLGELREKTSEEYLPRRSPSVGTEQSHQQVNGGSDGMPPRRRSSVQSPLKPTLEGKAGHSGPQTVFEDEGDPIPNTPIVVYKSKTRPSSVDDDDKYVRTDQSKRSSRRPSHERRDSRDTLRKLAKATSASPSPTTERYESNPESDEANVKPSKDEETSTAGREDEATFKPRDNASYERPHSSKDDPTSMAKTLKQVEKTPQPSRSIANLKTPLVTGAWIDTPLPVGGQMLMSPDIEHKRDLTPESNDQQRKLGATDLIRKLNSSPLSTRNKAPDKISPINIRPSLPKSALEAIISAAKAASNPASHDTKASSDEDDEKDEEDQTLLLGDSTIQSLEDLLANDTDFAALLDPSTRTNRQHGSSMALQAEENEDLPSDNDLPDESQSYTHLTTRLSNLGLSIRDAKKGLASLERAVSSAPASQTLERAPEGECKEAGEFHDFIWPCERCGCSGRRGMESAFGGWQTVSLPVPRLWTWRKGEWVPRLTWLGWATAVGWGLLVGEWVAWFVTYPRFP